MKPNGKGYNKNNGNISIETIWESLVLRPYGRGQYRFDMGKVTTEKIWERLAKRQTEKCKHGENLGERFAEIQHAEIEINWKRCIFRQCQNMIILVL